MTNPVFQHRHYKAMARVLATTTLGSRARDALANDMANYFERDNPNFDRERFMAAAKGEPTNGRDK